MTFIKRTRLSGLCLAGVCLTAILVGGLAAGASARPSLLFLPVLEKFPYRLAGKGGTARLETVGGATFSAFEVDALAVLLSTTLLDLHLELLGVVADFGPCRNAGKPAGVLANLLGHLGLSDPGLAPGVLLLYSAGFMFICEVVGVGTLVLEEIRGSLVGLIKPKVNQATTLLTLAFEQKKGIQKWTLFLLGEQQLKNQLEELSQDEKAFEQLGQEGEITLHALPKEGPFLVRLDP